MVMSMENTNERLVKSEERIRDLGEVFTPSATVQAMLALLPQDMWAIHPSPTFLEPACGDGNFLVAILEHKLDRIARDFSNGRLPAGDTPEAAQFHGLEALASIYAVDISVDNIVGDKAGHDLGARRRLLKEFAEWNKHVLAKRLEIRSLMLRAAEWVVLHSVLVGNMLPFGVDGQPSGRDSIPIIEYCFEPVDLLAAVRVNEAVGLVVAPWHE